MRWKIFDRDGSCVGIVDGTAGIMPDPVKLFIPIPELGAARGDILVDYSGVGAVDGADCIRLDTREKLYALRDGFGGRQLVEETFPRLTVDLPEPEREDGGQTWDWGQRRGRGYNWLPRKLADARRWCHGDLDDTVILKLGTAGRVSEQVEAESDAGAIDALLSAVGAAV